MVVFKNYISILLNFRDSMPSHLYVLNVAIFQMRAT